MNLLRYFVVFAFISGCTPNNPTSQPTVTTALPTVTITATPSPSTTTASPNVTVTPTSNASSVTFLNGSWLGKYECAQGITRLLLVITTNSSNIDAVFNFSADNNNPNVPSGSFRMTGNYDSISKKLTLNATNWIDKPANYIIVDFEGLVSPSEKSIVGNVIGTSCTAFMLKKIE